MKEINIDKKAAFWFLAAVTFIGFLSFIYSDIAETTRCGMNVCKLLFEGNIRNYYVYCTNCPISTYFGNTVVCVYDIPLFVLFALWNIPLYIYEAVTGCFAMDSFIGLLWAKCIILPFFFLTVKAMGKILVSLNGNDEQKTYMYCAVLSSAMFYIPFIIMGQYDIIYVTFMLYGIFYYIENNNRKFLFMFAGALLFKPFAVFALLPLIILRDKKIKTVIAKLFYSAVPYLVCKVFQKLFFYTSEESAQTASSSFISFVFQGKLPLFYDEVSVFFLVYLIFCIYVFFKLEYNENTDKRAALYIVLVSFSIFFITCKTHPQWILSIMPLMILLACGSDRKRRDIGILLETLVSFGYLLSCLMTYYWVFNVQTSAHMLPGTVFGFEPEYLGISIASIIYDVTQKDVELFNMVGGAIFCGSLLCFLAALNPFKRISLGEKTDVSPSYVFVFRIGLMMALFLSLVMLLV